MQTKSITEKDHSPTIICSAPWRLATVIAQDNYCLKVTFIDGAEGIVDLKTLIHSPRAGVFAQLKDLSTFNQVHLHYGVATWPGELDLAPDIMHDHVQKYGHWTVDVA